MLNAIAVYIYHKLASVTLLSYNLFFGIINVLLMALNNRYFQKELT